MNDCLAYIANGRLFTNRDDGETPNHQEVTSQFGQELKERLLKIKRQHEWKTQGRGGQFMGGGMVWGAENNGSNQVHPTISSVCTGAAPSEYFYSLQAGDVTGIFHINTETGDEKRHSHSTEHIVHSLHFSPEAEKLVCSVSGNEGLKNLALYDPQRGGFRELTEGDSLDTCPRWVPGTASEIVYQSAGIGRNRDGIWIDNAAASIERINLETGDISTIAAVDGSDLLAPQITSDGSLYCIRRPHKELKERGLGGTLLEILLLPLRLLQAIFGFLNFFSAMFSGKPLMTAGGPEKKGPDPKQLFLYGNLVDAEQARIEASKKGEELPSIVPRSWELVRFKLTEGETATEPDTLAKGVIAFSATEDGKILYSNGSALFETTQNGKRKVLSKIQDVEHLIC